MLGKNNLKSIKTLVGEIVAESEERIKATVDVKVEMAVDDVKQEFTSQIDGVKQDLKEVKRSIDDLIETNRFFLGKFNNHEKRIDRLETKLGVVK